MFSQLARGVGTLSGELRLEAWTEEEKDVGPLFPSIYSVEESQADHRHGITVSPRAKSAILRAKSAAPLRPLHQEKQGGELYVPKTFITRKGALMLFTDHELELTEKDHNYLMGNADKMLKDRYVQYCEKFGSLSRLTQSVLNFGDQDALLDEDKSITDPDNKVFVGFYHGSESKGVDLHSKPGGDINFYLRDIKSRAASARPRLSVADGQGGGLRSVTGFDSSDKLTQAGSQVGGVNDTGRSGTAPPPSRAQSASSLRSQRSVLSADKLTASLRSGSYHGRPSPQTVTPIPEAEVEIQAPTPRSRAASLQSDPRSRPVSSKSRVGSRRSHQGRSRPQSGGSRPASGRSGPHSKTGLLGANLDGSVTDIPEGTTEAVSSLHDSQSLHEPEGAEHLGVKYVEVDYVNEFDGMPDGDMFDDVQSVSSSVLQEEEILLPDVPEAQEGETVGRFLEHSNRRSQPASRKPSVQASIRSRRSSHTASVAGDIAEDEVFSASMMGATKPQDTQYPMSGLLLSQGSGTFSLDAAQADVVNESDVVIDAAPPRMLSHKDSMASSDRRTPQDETLQDLKGLRGSMTSVASSHSGMATERARTVLKEEGMADRVGSAHSRRGSVPVGSRPGSAQARSGRLSQGSRPGSAPVSGIAQGSRPGSGVPRDSRPGSSRSYLGEEKPGTPAPPASPVGSRPASPKVEGEKQPTDLLLSQKALSSKVSLVSQKDEKGEKDSISVASDRSVEPVGMKVEVVTKPPEPERETAKPDVESQMDRIAPVKDTITPTPQESPKAKDPEPEKTSPKAATEIITAKHAPEPKPVTEPTPAPQSNPTKSDDKKAQKETKKTYTKAMDINQVATPVKKEKKVEPKKAPTEKNRNLKAELDALNKPLPEKKTLQKKPIVKPAFKPPKPIMPQKTQEQKEYENLQKEVGSILSSVSKEAVDEDGIGLSPEELELQKQILEEKMAKAQAKLKDTEPAEKGKKGAAKTKEKTGKKGAAKKPQISEEEKKSLEEQREALRQAKKLEKQRRLEEAKQLEEKIKQKEEEKEMKLKDAQYKKQKEMEERANVKSLVVEPLLCASPLKQYGSDQQDLLDEELRDREDEARAAVQAEEEAREMLAAARKQQKEEREAKRKAEVERKKEAAAQRRADQKKREEAARQREFEMLLRISDNEEKIRLQEEERKRKEEAEETERELREEDERLAIKALEEEEEKIAELERQAEEEAMVRLVKEREDAEEKQREMEEESRRSAEEEERKRRQLEEEQRRLEEEATKREEEEAMRREDERQRLLELKRMEEAARDQMRFEMEKRRDLALRRRDVNVERRGHLHGLKSGQGMTKPWVFSYYLLWPRETYEKLMGEDPKKKKGFRAPPKKPKPAS